MTRDDPLDAMVVELMGPGATLREGQREAVEAVQEHDTVAVLATGTGKTLVYALAGKLLGGPTLVVSPTIALQEDQASALPELGRRAEALNSTRSPARRRRALERFAAGEVDVLLTSPEQLSDESVVAAVRPAAPALFVVDEAHCVGGWGEDFRPEYLALGATVEALGRPRVLALTATAPPTLRAQIIAALGMRDTATIVGDVDRPEIVLSARTLSDEDAVDDATIELLESADGTAIVYAATRRRVEELAATLRRAGLDPVAYHGGTAARARREVHRGFRDGSVELVVATSAFGLGVDRPDVRLVVHVDAPDSLEDYWQEAGRAGRDGQDARAVLLSRPGGYGLRRYFAAGAGAGEKDLRAVVGALDGSHGQRVADIAAATDLSRSRVRRAVNALVRTGAVTEGKDGIHRSTDRDASAVVDAAVRHVASLRARRETGVELVRRYAETTDCRRRLVLEILGEPAPEPCGRCDNCLGGTSTAADERPFALGSRVEHAEWGSGTVAQYEGDRVSVLFDGGGYHTLALGVVQDKHLLSAAPDAGAA